MKSRNWTLADIPDLTGKVMIVTGGNNGLGFQAVKAFAEKGAEVIISCRSVQKGEEAKSHLIKHNANLKISVMQLDLMDLVSIRNFAAKFKKNYERLDVLLNNAGIMAVPYNQTKDRFESQIGTNHLGHFALTGLLLDVLKKTPESRVVTVSSLAHKMGTIDFDNFLFKNEKDYTPMNAYGRSKLCNLLFTFELQRFFELNQIDCKAVAAHPGVSNTDLFKHMGGKVIQAAKQVLFSLFIQSPAMGVLPELRASVDPAVKGGEFYGPDKMGELKGYPVLVQANKAAYDTEKARTLWDLSEQLTGVKFV